MQTSRSGAGQKRAVVIFAALALVITLLIVRMCQPIWQVVVQPTPTSTAVALLPTETATSLPPTATATNTSVPPTATAVPPTSTATSLPPTPTAVPPTSTPTSVPPTPTPVPPTPTLDSSVVYPPPEGDLPVSEDLDVPEITLPHGEQESQATEIAFAGSAPPGAQVVVYDNDVPAWMVVADDEGRWDLKPPQELARQEHVIVARVTDGKHVSRPSEPVRVAVIEERLPVTGEEQPAARDVPAERSHVSARLWLPLSLALLLLCAGLFEGVLSPRRHVRRAIAGPWRTARRSAPAARPRRGTHRHIL